MLGQLARILGVESGKSADVTTEKDIQIATCAVLLEMAHIDNQFSDVERENIIAIFKDQYGLSDQDAMTLMDTSQLELDGSIDLWRFTNAINEHYGREEKIRLIELVWRIAYSDGRLDQHEDYLVHKLANLLRLDHKDLIEAKLRVKQEL